MAYSYFASTGNTQMYQNEENVIAYGNLANAALDVGTLANTGFQASTAMSQGEWGEVSDFFNPALSQQAGSVGLDISGVLASGAQQQAGTANVQSVGSNAGGGGGGSSAMTSHTIAAASVAIGANNLQSTQPAPAFTCSAMTTSAITTRQSNCGNNAFSSLTSFVQSAASTGNQVTQTIQQAVNTASTAVQSAVHTIAQSISSFLGSFHW